MSRMRPIYQVIWLAGDQLIVEVNQGEITGTRSEVPNHVK